MTDHDDRPARLEARILDGGAILVDALPRLPLSRERVVIAAAIAARQAERQRERDKASRATTSLTARLKTIKVLGDIAILSLRAQGSRAKTLLLDRNSFEGIAETWGRLVGAPLGIRHALPADGDTATTGHDAGHDAGIETRRSA